MTSKQLKASLAENFIAEILIKQDWKILGRNFRHIGTELDLIAHKKKQSSLLR